MVKQQGFKVKRTLPFAKIFILIVSVCIRLNLGNGNLLPEGSKAKSGAGDGAADGDVFHGNSEFLGLQTHPAAISTSLGLTNPNRSRPSAAALVTGSGAATKLHIDDKDDGRNGGIGNGNRNQMHSFRSIILNLDQRLKNVQEVNKVWQQNFAAVRTGFRRIRHKITYQLPNIRTNVSNKN